MSLLKEAALDAAKADYTKILKSARARRSSDPIPNLYPWHCELAVRELIEFGLELHRTKSINGGFATIRILTGSCPNHVYGRDATKLFDEFANSGGHIRALVWSESIDAERNAMCQLAKKYPKTVEVRVSRISDNADKIFHFFEVDGEAYRLEAPHKPVSAHEFSDIYPEIPARICFNDPKTGSMLRAMFDKIWAEFKTSP
jgi:hypothetical protein